MDLMSVCRTCMSSTSLNPIFPLPEVHERFSKAVYLITGVKVTINDGLPQNMCIECLKHVNDSMKFRAKCKETEETLLKIKCEVKRAERHNTYIADKKDIVREIKVENRWIKINNLDDVTHDDDDDEDEQPLVHFLNTQTNNNIQNVYINEADGQIIPLEMLKVEMDTSHIDDNSYDSTMNEQDDTVNEEDYSISNPEYIVNDLEDPCDDQEDTMDNQEDTMDDQEDTMDNQEDIVADHENTINDHEDPINSQVKTINDHEGNIINQEHIESQEDTVNDNESNINREYAIINSETIINDQNDTTIKPEYTITINNLEGNRDNEKHIENVTKKNTVKNTENNDLLKTYYIMKDTLEQEQTDTADNSEYDNINISENQDIVVMDNRESLYVIDMSNPSSKRVTCKLCQKNLSIRSIDLHLSKSHPGADGRRIKCQLCDNFVIREKMVQHKLVMHGTEAFQCRYCKSTFEKEETLIEHVVSCDAKKKRKTCESGKEMVECEVCHKTMQKASLRLHTAMTHAGLRPVCDHCGKSFGNKFRLNEHCRAKHGYEKLKCSYCSFESASNLALRNHERRHRGEKPYVCERCGAKFHASYLLAQHRHSHRTDRKYKCEVCSMCFKTNNSLHSHRRGCHGGMRRVRRARPRPPATDALTGINDVHTYELV